MPNKEYDKIIQQIKEGLTGVSEHDIPYLDDMTSQYKDHPLAREILR